MKRMWLELFAEAVEVDAKSRGGWLSTRPLLALSAHSPRQADSPHAAELGGGI